MQAHLEHINVTVTDPERTAGTLCDIFGWKIRWSGPSMMGGRTIHVGADDDYLAIYTTDEPPTEQARRGARGGMSHIGVVVADLDAVEERVKAAGYTPHTHGDYEPGRRFYFDDHDGIEFEVVSYN